MNKVSIEYIKHMDKVLMSFPHEAVAKLVDWLEDARRNSKNIFVMGNGGSASTASHWVCDMNKGASYGQSLRYRMICLNDSISTTMAYSNDVSYDVVFVEQLKNFLSKGDLVIGVSGSGNSKNVIGAIEYARQAGARTVGLTGYSGGKLKNLAELSVHFNVDDMQIVEDLHLMTTHICMRATCQGPASC